ncbi:hypothetical protein JTB14_026532 [Gonioctena quinquepunctata]|nr:hypothetical protein JTB14_026532 [Gonioctena quinquepunctata]
MFLEHLIANNDCESILSVVSKNLEKYTEVLQNELKDIRILSLIVGLNAKLCESTFVANKFKILNATLCNHFNKHLNGYISTLILEDKDSGGFWKTFEKFLQNLFVIFENALDIMPSSCWRSVQSTLKLIEVNIKLIEKERKIQFVESLGEKLVSIKEQADKIELKLLRKTKMKKRNEDILEDEPEDDYREMDLFPSVQELVVPERNFVRKNVVSGTLVLFSNDDFRTVFCGVVAKNERLREGRLTVGFKDNTPLMRMKYKMIECVIYFEPYYQVLSVLQKLPLNSLPMSEYITEVQTSITPPRYITSEVTPDCHGLNTSQAKALHGALNRELVVIQGPPGTGKTFLGLKIVKELLENSSSWKSSGPIIVVCFTNHALDQFLEGIIPLTSKIVSEKCIGNIIYTLPLSEMRNTRFHIQNYIQENEEYKQICTAMFENGELGGEDLIYIIRDCNQYAKDLQSDLKIITDKITMFEYCSVEQHGPPPEQIDYEKPFDIPSRIRWQLYDSWIKAMKEDMVEQIQNLTEEYREKFVELNELREPADVKLMRKMDVVGMTTTCAARMHSVVKKLESPIVIVEEAAEVLEAHIVTVLTEHCQHLILLGDHQQLKPSTSDYVLQQKFDLGVSLFERMVNNNIQCHTLNVQHRMRPEISSLICPVIYPDLTDHESVHKFPAVAGVQHSVYFVDHEEPEEPFGDSSRLNMFEAKFLVKLTEYLLNMYQPEEITVLAGYAGQVVTLQKEMDLSPRRNARNVKITAVDNFQGEENKIILLSLVRNNNENNVGFLKIENRICVALSRAKHGLFITGNMEQLCASSKIWKAIKERLSSRNAIRRCLPLICQIHNTETLVKYPEDFGKVPEGGCNEPCGAQLECGHVCIKKCHVYDRDHETYECNEPCNRSICNEAGHDLCTKRCHELCGKCEYRVTETLPCGHLKEVMCYMKTSLEKIKCTKNVSIDLPCGHVANKLCHVDKESFLCPFPCDVSLPNCVHKCALKCHEGTELDHKLYSCAVLCERENDDCSRTRNKHKSTRACHLGSQRCRELIMKFRKDCYHLYRSMECYIDVNQMTCTRPCKKNLSCGHKCPNKCYQSCGPCEKQVTAKITECGHFLIIKCGETALQSNCSKSCSKKLDCERGPTTLVSINRIVKNASSVLQTKLFHAHQIKAMCNKEPKKENCKEQCRKLMECEHRIHDAAIDELQSAQPDSIAVQAKLHILQQKIDILVELDNKFIDVILDADSGDIDIDKEMEKADQYVMCFNNFKLRVQQLFSATSSEVITDQSKDKFGSDS